MYIQSVYPTEHTLGRFLPEVVRLWFGWAINLSESEFIVEQCLYSAVVKLRLSSSVVNLCLYRAAVNIFLYSAVVKLCL